MNYIVFDLEWNQPADIKSTEKRKLQFEIIEIGAVKLDENKNIISSFNELVCPKVYKTLNWHTQKMLKIKMSDLKEGSPFTDVCRRFLNWCGEDVMFCSWGPQDLTELQRNMDYFGMKPLSDGPIPFYDIQHIFAKAKKEEDTTRNLEAAVDMMEIDKDIVFHRAYSDAYYTAKIFKELPSQITKNSVTYDIYHLPKTSKDEIRHTQGRESYYLSTGYDQREDITGNRKILSIGCPRCSGRALRPKIRWYSTNSKVYYGAAICSVHGPIKAKLRIKKNEFGKYYAEKFLSYCPISDVEELKQKKRSIKANRKQTPKDAIPGKVPDAQNSKK